MRRSTIIVAVTLLVTSVAVVPVAGLAASPVQGLAKQDPQTDSAANETTANASIEPGEQLSGIISVHGAELEGDVDQRAFGLRVARAATNAGKADVVQAQLEDVRNRLDRLTERKRELNASRANGSISDGRYRADVATLAANIQTVNGLVNQSATASAGLPEALLASRGINVTAIQHLNDRASRLAGPQVANIARSIAGPGVGPVGPPEGIPAGSPGTVAAGPPGDQGSQATTQSDGTPTAPDGAPTPPGNQTTPESAAIPHG